MVARARRHGDPRLPALRVGRRERISRVLQLRVGRDAAEAQAMVRVAGRERLGGRGRVERAQRYDRPFLLTGAKRNTVLDLWEVERYGIDSYGDAEWVSIYGLRPSEWYARGVRLLGRTVVECTRDRLGDAIGQQVAALVRHASPLVVDLFAGSGNTLHWLLRHLPGARGLGFEIDPRVFALTKANLETLALPVKILNVDYVTGLADVRGARDQLLVVFIAPPWGEALDRTSGLDHRDPGRPRSRRQREPAPLCRSGVRKARSRLPRRGADAPRLVGAANLRPERARREARCLAGDERMDS